MKPHKRNGKAARARRKETANDRAVTAQQYRVWLDKHLTLPAEDRLIAAIFGSWRTCDECHADVLVGTDCMTPHCKAIRNEDSVFYDEVTDDHITIKGATMVAGVDY